MPRVPRAVWRGAGSSGCGPGRFRPRRWARWRAGFAGSSPRPGTKRCCSPGWAAPPPGIHRAPAAASTASHLSRTPRGNWPSRWFCCSLKQTFPFVVCKRDANSPGHSNAISPPRFWVALLCSSQIIFGRHTKCESLFAASLIFSYFSRGKKKQILVLSLLTETNVFRKNQQHITFWQTHITPFHPNWQTW